MKTKAWEISFTMAQHYKNVILNIHYHSGSCGNKRLSQYAKSQKAIKIIIIKWFFFKLRLNNWKQQISLFARKKILTNTLWKRIGIWVLPCGFRIFNLLELADVYHCLGVNCIDHSSNLNNFWRYSIYCWATPSPLILGIFKFLISEAYFRLG